MLNITEKISGRTEKTMPKIIERIAKECKITTRTVYRLLKEPLDHKIPKQSSAGRKRKVSERTEKRMIRNVSKIRAHNKNWIVRDLHQLTDIDNIMGSVRFNEY